MASMDMLTDGGVNYMIQASHAERAARIADGHAGALDFILGLTGDPDGWALLHRLEEEKPHLKGITLWMSSRRVGSMLAITAPTDLTFGKIARTLLEET